MPYSIDSTYYKADDKEKFLDWLYSYTVEEVAAMEVDNLAKMVVDPRTAILSYTPEDNVKNSLMCLRMMARSSTSMAYRSIMYDNSCCRWCPMKIEGDSSCTAYRFRGVSIPRIDAQASKLYTAIRRNYPASLVESNVRLLRNAVRRRRNWIIKTLEKKNIKV